MRLSRSRLWNLEYSIEPIGFYRVGINQPVRLDTRLYYWNAHRPRSWWLNVMGEFDRVVYFTINHRYLNCLSELIVLTNRTGAGITLAKTKHNFKYEPRGHRSSCRFFRFSFRLFPWRRMNRCRCGYWLSFFQRFSRRCGRRFVLLFNPRNLVILAGLSRHRCRHFSDLDLRDKKNIFNQYITITWWKFPAKCFNIFSHIPLF